MRAALLGMSVLALSAASGAKAAPDDAAVRTALLAKIPKLAVIQNYDLGRFEEIAAAYAAGQRQGRPADELQRQAMDAAAFVYSDKVAVSPDKAVLAVLASMLSSARELQSKASDRCVALLNGRLAEDIRPLLSPETIAAEAEVDEALFQSTSYPSVQLSAAEEARLMIGPIASVSATLEVSESSIAQAAAGIGPPGTVCQMQTAILRALSEETPAAAAAVIRRRFSAEKPES